MLNLNTVALVGVLAADPERVQHNGQSTIVNLQVEVADKDRQGNPTTAIVPIKSFGRTAEFALSSLRQGDTVLVNGKVNSREYQGKWYVEIMAWELSTDADSAPAQQQPAQQQRQQAPPAQQRQQQPPPAQGQRSSGSQQRGNDDFYDGG